MCRGEKSEADAKTQTDAASPREKANESEEAHITRANCVNKRSVNYMRREKGGCRGRGKENDLHLKKITMAVTTVSSIIVIPIAMRTMRR